MKIAFNENPYIKIDQPKGGRGPLQLQEAAENEIDKLLADGHDHRVEKINDEAFIQLVVINVKREQSVRIALDARSLNNAIQKEQHQMANLENLMEQITEIFNSREDGTLRLTSLDWLNADEQKELHPETTQQCNFE